MADPLRTRIRNSLIAALSDVAPHVDVVSDEPAEVRHDFPSITVHPVADEPVGDRQGAVGFSTRRALWALECWITETDSGESSNRKFSLADDVENFLAQVIRAVCADPQRNGLAFDTQIGAVVFLLVLKEARIAGFELQLSCVYRYLVGSPEG